jgi:hypothetical protein
MVYGISVKLSIASEMLTLPFPRNIITIPCIAKSDHSEKCT